MEINLIKNWQEFMQQEIAEAVDVSDEDIAKQYFYFKSRTFKTKPRQVLRAAEFECPHDWERGLNKLIHKFENGSNMLSHMDVKTSRDETAEDFLLADWGIYALKLKKRISGNREEEGPTIFAYITDFAAYFIKTYTGNSWNIQDIISTIDKNWPNLLGRQVEKGISGTPQPIDSDAYREIRKKGCNLLVMAASGRAFFAGNKMYDAGGDRVLLNKAVNDAKENLTKIEADLKNDESGLKERVEKESGKAIETLSIALGRERDGSAYIYEKNSNVVLSRLEGLFA